MIDLKTVYHSLQLLVSWLVGCAYRSFNIWGHIVTVPACSSGTLTSVLPHRTHDMTPHPVTVYRHGADLLLCYPRIWSATIEATTTCFNLLNLSLAPLFWVIFIIKDIFSWIAFINKRGDPDLGEICIRKQLTFWHQVALIRDDFHVMTLSTWHGLCCQAFC